MVVIGIDPGLDGGIAFLSHRGAAVSDLPTIALESGSVMRRVHGPSLAALIRANCPVGEPILAVVEDLSAGGQDSSQQTIGSQYRTRGTIECALEMLRLPVSGVNVRKWKNFYGLTKDKADALAIARELFPDLAGQLTRKKDHNRAEALLIANWGRKVLA